MDRCIIDDNYVIDDFDIGNNIKLLYYAKCSSLKFNIKMPEWPNCSENHKCNNSNIIIKQAWEPIDSSYSFKEMIIS